MVKFSLLFVAFCAILPAQMPTFGGGTPPPGSMPPPTDPNTVIITVGDHKITAGQFEDYIKALPQQYQATARGPGRRDFAKNLVELNVLADEAVKQGVAENPEVKLQIEFQRDNMLAQAMFLNLQQQAVVSDAQVQAYYDAHKSDYEILKARHILIRVKGAPMPATPGKPELTDAEAKAKAEEIRKRIVGGEDFAKVAEAESDDTTSGKSGGDLGEFRHGMMVPPFEKAAFALKPGEISEPVQTPFGYHIIQVESHTTKTLEEVKPEIVAKLRPQAAREAVQALTGQAKVEMNDAYFGPAPVAPGAPAPAAAAPATGAPAVKAPVPAVKTPAPAVKAPAPAAKKVPGTATKAPVRK
ncbi:MAG TPA: peptidylprolyl isomerase [Bryobacteraceae bacterium]|nr:peptidylprolyl isomerase [Bryobacteraceae bacterium]